MPLYKQHHPNYQLVDEKPVMSTEKKIGKWYFGGLSSAGAVCCTHPLDLIKVHLQTSSTEGGSILRSTVNIVKTQGILAMYSGLSASLVRQLTYSTTRFAIYEGAKNQVAPNNEKIGLLKRVSMSAFAGACGGFIGTPGDMVNVRMQNDVKLPPEQRRNYKHAIDGLVRVAREEGFRKLFNGADLATARAVFVTTGQLCFYDVVKEQLLSSGYFQDNLTAHFTSSLAAGAIATTLTQPLDVLKTRAMNSKPGDFKGPIDLLTFTAKQGPMAFYKGYIPAFLRLGPQTIITFMILEQLKANFGVLPNTKK
ncbi:mitochondrial dicarboxylate carrier isoform X1 [Lepeophtheirus salmonis]|nr:mitochondrial dicarboxylate carrier-like isoform X1 [Lepeophtheirus salmonis]